MSSDIIPNIQQDWKERDNINSISLSIQKIAEFLNKFGKFKFTEFFHSANILLISKFSNLTEVETRTRLAYMSDHISRLETQMEYVENRIATVHEEAQDDDMADFDEAPP